MNTNNVVVPELEHDAMMAREFGQKVGERGRTERRVVATLCALMLERGWVPVAVWDGERLEKTTDAKSAMEFIFNLDEASLRFAKPSNPKNWHGVLLVLGNGEDIVSDWNYSRDDADGFNADMEAVTKAMDY
jgi:hypothetical protein